MVFIIKLVLLFCVVVYFSWAEDNNTSVVDTDYGFSRKTNDHVTFAPYQCKLMAYNMKRALYRYEIDVTDEYDNGGNCNVSTDFFASELLTPKIYVPNPLPQISLPYQLCIQYITQNYDIPEEFKKFLNHSWIEGQNISFVNLQQGNMELENYTCYQGWRYQILFNNCSQEVQVNVEIGSGGYSDYIATYGCVEIGYTATFITIGVIVFVSLAFNCTCCCCLFCKCCLPCARFCARVDPKKLINDKSINPSKNNEQNDQFGELNSVKVYKGDKKKTLDAQNVQHAVDVSRGQVEQGISYRLATTESYDQFGELNNQKFQKEDQKNPEDAQDAQNVQHAVDVEVGQGVNVTLSEVSSRKELSQDVQNIKDFNLQNIPPLLLTDDYQLNNKCRKLSQRNKICKDDFQIEVQDEQNMQDLQEKNKNCNKKQEVKEINKRIKLYSMEGQCRWLTFCISIANLIYLYMQLYPPKFEHDPYRVDYINSHSICGQNIDDNSAGYIIRICKIATIFSSAYFIGISTFIIVQVNYTTRQDPWFIFRTVIATIVLIILDALFVSDNILYFYRSKFVEEPIGYQFAGLIVWIHLIAANFIFLFVIILGFGQKNPKNRILEQKSLLKKTLRKEKQKQQEITQQQQLQQEENNDNLEKKTRIEKFQNWLFSFWDALREEEGFKYSIFMLISVTAADYLIIFIFISLMYKREGYLDCLKDFNYCIWREMETHIVFIKKGNALDSVLSLLQNVNVTQLYVENVNNAIAQIYDDIQQPTQELAAVMRQISGIIDETENLLQQSQQIIVRTQESTDKWSETLDTPFMVASAIGLTIGLIMGLRMLYITLTNYKKITIHLTLEKVFLVLSKDDHKHHSETMKHNLENFTAVSSIFFFGIVLSTSAIQMYIFFFFWTFIFTVLFSPWFWTVFLRDYWGYVAVYGGYILMNMFIVVPLGKRLLSQKDQSIKYPALFLAYYIVCSFAYLLLGTLMAVWRIVYLLLTSLIAINRLDISLFTILPVLDNGHKAFMGMVLLSQAMAGVGHTQTRQQRKAKNNWKKLREAVQDEKGQLFEKLMAQVFESLEETQEEDRASEDIGDDDIRDQGDSEEEFDKANDDQIWTLRRFLYRSRTDIDDLDASIQPKAQIVFDKYNTFSGPVNINEEYTSQK